jgi:hypothetical protein
MLPSGGIDVAEQKCQLQSITTTIWRNIVSSSHNIYLSKKKNKWGGT